MSVCGIIAEYNPFHRGHAFQIEEIRRALPGAYIVAAMSGDFVQRGEAAMFPKELRARWALGSGADLVIGMPPCVSTGSAEFFAGGGVGLLSSLGVVTHLSFGWEGIPGCVDEEAFLQKAAKILNEEPESFSQTLRAALKEGLSFPAARQRALAAALEEDGEISGDLAARLTDELMHSPNNILALEYARAAGRLSCPLRLLPIRRIGSGYHETSLPPDRGVPKEGSRTGGREAEAAIASASAIRNAIVQAEREIRIEGRDDDTDALLPKAVTRLLKKLSPYIPEHMVPSLGQAIAEGGYLTEKDLDPVMLFQLLKESRKSLSSYWDVPPDLANRIESHIGKYKTFSSFAGILHARNYTDARIRRALIHVLLGIRQRPASSPYARILGFRKESAPLLRMIKEKASIPLLGQLKDAKKLLGPDAMALLDEDVRASHIYQGLLSQKTGMDFVHEYEKQIVVI